MPITPDPTDPHAAECRCVACLLCDAHNVHPEPIDEGYGCPCGHPVRIHHDRT